MSPTSAETSQSTTQVRTILLCGASVRSLAESAIAIGLRPLCVDFFQDLDLTQLLANDRGRFLGRIASFEEIPQLTRSIRSSVPLLWAGGMENHSSLLRTIAQRRRLIGPQPDIVDQVRDPLKLQVWLSEAGLNVPRLSTAATADSDRLWLRKPMRGSGGLGIRPHEASSSGGDSREYLQEYVDGVPMSAICSSIHRKVRIAGMSLQLTGWPSLGASDFLFCGNIGPVEMDAELTRQVLDAAEAIVNRSGLSGVFGIDFVLRQGRAWFLEVNPRLTASHMLYEETAPGQLLREHLAAFGLGPPPHRRKRHGMTELRFGSESVSARLILWAHAHFPVPNDLKASLLSKTNAVITLADLPHPGTIIPPGSPICSLCVNAGSIPEISATIAALTPLNDGAHRISWKAAGNQMNLLAERFRRNLPGRGPVTSGIAE